MKKITGSLLITAGLLFANQTAHKQTNKIKYLSKQDTVKLLKSLPNFTKLLNEYQNGITNIYVEKKDGFYIVMVKGERRGEFFVTKDKRYAIFGSVLDLKKKKAIIGDFPMNTNIIKKGVAFTYGVGKKNIYLVTDPQCPYCRMLERKKGDTLLKDYKIHVIIYPLPFHRYALPMTKYILAGKTNDEKAQRLIRILHGSNEWKNFHPTPEQEKKINKKLEEMKKAVNELGAQGTPTIYNNKFKQIPLQEIYQEK